MFVQFIKGRVADVGRFHTQAARWSTELRPGAIGFLGSTWGLTDDGTMFLAARFESAEAAARNTARPEQAAWWEATADVFDEVLFRDCTDVDTILGGGSDQAGFVQVISGRVKDQATARATLKSVEGRLAAARPEILGGVMGWHGDGGGFTQVMYFRSEQAAHAAEAGQADADLDRQYQEMMADPPSFIDLNEPHFD